MYKENYRPFPVDSEDCPEDRSRTDCENKYKPPNNKVAVRIEKLLLIQFRNYDEATFTFCSQLNCLLGENGSGKTNLLDAVYFLALTKSAFHNQDHMSIAHHADYFMLDGVFAEGDRKTEIKCAVHRTQRKALFADGKPYDKLSEHIGRFPVVLAEPGDTGLIREGSDVRRKFFDGVLSQTDQGYLRDLLAYNRYLGQRNALLKIFAERGQADHEMLDAYDAPLLDLCAKLSRLRQDFLVSFSGLFEKHYRELSRGKEAVEIVYDSELTEPGFEARFRQQRTVDIQAQRTTRGLHKDEFIFNFDGVPLRKFGSQGQLKSFVLAMRLAQFELIEKYSGVKPILLLDDIFDKLDELRIEQLLSMIERGFFGQVFISDARPERSRQIFEKLGCEKKFFDIKKG